MRRVAALAVCLLLAGCSGGDGDPAPTPSPDLTIDQLALAELADRGAKATYDGRYDFVASPGGEKGTIRIVATPPKYRIEIAGPGRTALYFDLAGEKISCSVKDAKTTCLLVARPGEPAPELFDPGVDRIFRDAVAELAARPGSYGVKRLPDAPAREAIPKASCFQVQRVVPAASASGVLDQAAGFETGNYCFAELGVLTSVTISTGTMTLTALSVTVPAALFTPPATPAALPSLTPSPS